MTAGRGLSGPLESSSIRTMVLMRISIREWIAALAFFSGLATPRFDESFVTKAEMAQEHERIAIG